MTNQNKDDTSTQEKTPVTFPKVTEKPDGVFLPMIRYALITAGSHYVRNGYLSENELQTIVGGLVMVGTTIWLIYNKKVRGV